MSEYMNMGGVFMWPLNLLAVAVAVLVVKKAYDLFVNPDQPAAALEQGLHPIIQIGIFSFFLGIFGQAIGLYEAMIAIESAGDISPALLAGGMKVSMIVPLYGMIILLCSAICWFVLNLRYKTLVAE